MEGRQRMNDRSTRSSHSPLRPKRSSHELEEESRRHRSIERITVCLLDLALSWRERLGREERRVREMDRCQPRRYLTLKGADAFSCVWMIFVFRITTATCRFSFLLRLEEGEEKIIYLSSSAATHYLLLDSKNRHQ